MAKTSKLILPDNKLYKHFKMFISAFGRSLVSGFRESMNAPCAVSFLVLLKLYLFPRLFYFPLCITASFSSVSLHNIFLKIRDFPIFLPKPPYLKVQPVSKSSRAAGRKVLETRCVENNGEKINPKMTTSLEYTFT